MSTPILSSTILKSLQLIDLHPDLSVALLMPNQTKARNRHVGKYWDYKESLYLHTRHEIAEFARDAAAFHNTDGGMIAVGITNDFVAKGITSSEIADSAQLNHKIRAYLGADIQLWSTSLPLPQNRHVWLIFIPRNSGSPRQMLRNGPEIARGKSLFVRGDVFYRDGDQTKRCTDDVELDRVFRGLFTNILPAYTYEIDEPYFRLLNRNYEHFFGREPLREELKSLLSVDAKPPIVALDGGGGVGKAAVAIKVARELYDESRHYFIVSLSAKTEVWAGHIDTRRAGFAGLHGLLSEIAAVFPDIRPTDDTSRLKRDIIRFVKDYPGLFVIDNIEEVTDSDVFKFLSLEVPNPTKILVTSRLKKEMGAFTRSVPEMSRDEATQLLDSELERLGYTSSADDEEHFQTILNASGRVPLAIKWAAQIAAERRSLLSAAHVLQGAGNNELLSFCFATMYESLSDVEKDVARLLPYLEAEWTPLTLSIALDLPVDTVVRALHEISDKGLTFDNGKGGYSALPLTKVFLRRRWSDNAKLQQTVAERFGEMFASDESPGLLLDWPLERRVGFLRQHSRGKAEAGEFDKALKLVQLAQTWTDVDSSFRFLQGQILYKMGSMSAGIGHMRQAIRLDKDADILTGDELLFYTEALLDTGNRNSEKEALDVALSAISRGGKVSFITLARVIDCSLQRRDYRTLANLVTRVEEDDKLLKIFQAIGGLLKSTSFVLEYEVQIVPALKRLCASGLLDDDVQRDYEAKLQSIEELLGRQRR